MHTISVGVFKTVSLFIQINLVMKYSYKSRFYAVLFSLAAVVLMSVTAKAELVDLGALSPDVTYQIPEYKEVKASFTPSVSGSVKMLWTCNPLHLYGSPECSEESAIDGSHSYTQNGQLMVYSDLEAGHTYYLYSSMTLMAGELIIREGDTEIELVSSDPSLDPESPYYYGGRFSASQSYRINLEFNYPVTVGNCFLIAGSERRQINPTLGNTTVSFDVNDVVMSFYHDGLLKEGDKMTLRVLQIKDATNPDIKFGGNGKLEIDFEMAAKPAELVETKGFSTNITDNPLNSYYFPGDEAAQMTLVFDREISGECNPVANISYGNPDNLDLGVYKESIPGSVDGAVVSFDFSGKLRRRIDMIPGANLESLPLSLYVSFADIFSEDGQRAYTGMISNPSGFATSYTLNELQYFIAADFTPARGTELKSGDEMEIWVMNGGKIQFDSVCIDYVDNGELKTVTVHKENITAVPDPDSLSADDMLFYFTIPDFSADAGSELSLYMKGLVCADGLDHSGDVRGNFVYGTSGVDGIDTGCGSDKADVFDITGKLVLRSVGPSQLSGLDKGVYIYNGKKIIIR